MEKNVGRNNYGNKIIWTCWWSVVSYNESFTNRTFAVSTFLPTLYSIEK